MVKFNPVEIEFNFPEIPPNVDTKMRDFLLELRGMLRRRFISLGNISVPNANGLLIGGDTIEALLISSGLRVAQVVSVAEDYYLCKFVTGNILADTSNTHAIPIATIAELNNIRNNMSGRYEIVSDLDLTDATSSGGTYWDSGSGWDPIGSASIPFTGTIEGNGHTITGMFIDRDAKVGVGLFGYVSASCSIRNLTLHNSNVTGLNNTGPLVGQSFGYLYNCHATGTNTITGTAEVDGDDVGGLVGDNDGIIILCSASGTIEGSFDVGGLCGDNDEIIMFSWSTAAVNGCKAGDIGGLVGDNKGFKIGVPISDRPHRGTIFGCYSTGAVTSSNKIGAEPAGDIGGLVGDNKAGSIVSSWSTSTVSGYQPQLGGLAGDSKNGDNELDEIRNSFISNCYATGNITCLGVRADDGAVGGLVGDIDEAQVVNSYCSNQITDSANRKNRGDFAGDADGAIVDNCFYNSTIGTVGSSPRGTAKTTAQLKQQDTFTGWDFSNTWAIVEDTSFPTLSVPVPATVGGDESSDSDIIDVYPIGHEGTTSLASDVLPKIKPGQFLLVTLGEDDVYYTPISVHDLGSAIGWQSGELAVIVDDVTIEVSSSKLRLKSVTKIFELSYNKASNGDIDAELNSVGTAGTVSGASGQNENGVYGQALDPNVKEAVVWSGFVPYDYVSGDIVIKCRWCLAANGDAGATNWRWHSIWNEVEVADATVIGNETVSSAVDEAVGAGEPQRTMHTITLVTISTLTAGDLLTVTLMRDAIHANDDCTKKIMVLDKIHAEFTSTKRGS